MHNKNGLDRRPYTLGFISHYCNFLCCVKRFSNAPELYYWVGIISIWTGRPYLFRDRRIALFFFVFFDYRLQFEHKRFVFLDFESDSDGGHLIGFY